MKARGGFPMPRAGLPAPSGMCRGGVADVGSEISNRRGTSPARRRPAFRRLLALQVAMVLAVTLLAAAVSGPASIWSALTAVLVCLIPQAPFVWRLGGVLG